MIKSILRNLSKYRKMDEVVSSLKPIKKEVEIEKEINFKPFINSVYEKYGNIKPYSEMTFDITTPNDIPYFMYKKPEMSLDVFSDKNTKRLNVALLGPANSGKSLLLNKLVDRFVSAVSNKSFTTEIPITGLKTELSENLQLILKDLPSFQNYRNQPRLYGRKAFEELDNWDHDLIMIVLDCNKKISKEIFNFFTLLNKKNKRNSDLVLVMNKIDLCFNRRKLTDLIGNIEGLINVEKKFFVSAETDYGISELLDYLNKKSKDGKWLYSPEFKTDMSEIQICEQIIKSIVYDRYFKEFPYEIQIKLTNFTIKNTRIFAEVQFNCERPIHKDILIGKKGQNTLILKNYIQKFLTQTYNKEVEIQLDIKSGLKTDFNNIIVEDEYVKEMEMNQIKKIRKGQSLKDIDKSDI